MSEVAMVLLLAWVALMVSDWFERAEQTCTCGASYRARGGSARRQVETWARLHRTNCRTMREVQR